MTRPRRVPPPSTEREEFGELLRYTLAGYAAGVLAGVSLDAAGVHRSGTGQWLVRTLAGEGESVFEGLFALRRRLAGATGSLAESYGWGKAAGMAFPWAVDLASRAAGVEMYGPESFYIPFLYAMSDQVGAVGAGLIHFKRRERAWGRALAAAVRHPVLLAGLGVILVVPVGLLAARISGFAPTTQVRTALETAAANLCWVPPLAGWWAARRASR